MAGTASGLRQDQHCSDIAEDGRFARPCREQRQQRGSAPDTDMGSVELAVAVDAIEKDAHAGRHLVGEQQAGDHAQPVSIRDQMQYTALPRLLARGRDSDRLYRHQSKALSRES